MPVVVIDLRSDTVTQPTPEMRRAIADAVVGDEQKREDPTVLELERRVAELLGHEAAVFLPTATMANQVALKLHGQPGDVLRGGVSRRAVVRIDAEPGKGELAHVDAPDGHHAGGLQRCDDGCKDQEGDELARRHPLL